ncbi:hypothetical protein AKO1_006180 [Acrasis kona]|uniref:Uncharacterized protein n=1 Tax=Acrasis kona TaxID=1008807 RepID=A0AAW2YHH2_9EUKA
MNFVNSRPARRGRPVCLPGLSASQYVYAYIDFLALDMCIVMICSGGDVFHECSAAKQRILEDLIDCNIFQQIISDLKKPGYSVRDVLTPVYLFESGLRHFVYRSNIHSQWSCAEFDAPYQHIKQRKRLCRVYKTVREKLKQYCDRSPHKIFFQMTDCEAVIGLMSANFELYACFSLMVSKSSAISVCDQIKKFIARTEDSLFISAFPCFA